MNIYGNQHHGKLKNRRGNFIPPKRPFGNYITWCHNWPRTMGPVTARNVYMCQFHGNCLCGHLFFVRKLVKHFLVHINTTTRFAQLCKELLIITNTRIWNMTPCDAHWCTSFKYNADKHLLLRLGSVWKDEANPSTVPQVSLLYSFAHNHTSVKKRDFCIMFSPPLYLLLYNTVRDWTSYKDMPLLFFI